MGLVGDDDDRRVFKHAFGRKQVFPGALAFVFAKQGFLGHPKPGQVAAAGLAFGDLGAGGPAAGDQDDRRPARFPKPKGEVKPGGKGGGGLAVPLPCSEHHDALGGEGGDDEEEPKDDPAHSDPC